MAESLPDRSGGDGLPLDVRIQTARYALFRLLRADAPHKRLREEWSKLEALLDSPIRDGAEGATVEVPHEDCLNCHCAVDERCAGYRIVPPKPAPSLDTNSVADSTGEKTGTHGASKEAGGHSRGGLTPVSTLSEEPAAALMREKFKYDRPAPDAMREALDARQRLVIEWGRTRIAPRPTGEALMTVSETLANFDHLPADVQKHLEELEEYIGHTDGKSVVTWNMEPENTCIDEGTIDSSEAVTAFNGIVACLTAALSDRAGEWQDISAAPKDGTSFLATMAGGGDGPYYVPYYVLFWNGNFFESVDSGEGPSMAHITHWQTPPTPPREVESE